MRVRWKVCGFTGKITVGLIAVTNFYDDKTLVQFLSILLNTQAVHTLTL